MDHEQASCKTIVSMVVSSIVLKGDSAFWGGEQLLSPKIEVVGGLPNPPPEGALKEKLHEKSGINRLILAKAYCMPKIRNMKLQRFYIQVMVKMTIFVAL